MSAELDWTHERPEHWSEQALCAQAYPELFYPRKGEGTMMAKAVCGRCPVRSECLEDALARNETFGVFGGLSERERQALKKKRAAA